MKKDCCQGCGNKSGSPHRWRCPFDDWSSRRVVERIIETAKDERIKRSIFL